MKLRDTDFLTISSRIKYREANLLDSVTADKLIDASGDDEVMKLLSDKGYDGQGVNLGDKGFLTSIIEGDRKNVAELVASASMFSLFLYPNDYQNIKVALKNEIVEDKRDIFTDGGSVPLATLQKAVTEREFAPLTELMASGITEALEVYSKTSNPQYFDIILDKYCYMDMSKAAKELGIAFLIDYVILLIDIANVKSLLRLRKMGKSHEFAKGIFFEGGSVPAERYASAYTLGEEETASALGNAAELYTTALATINGGGGMSALEYNMDNLLMSHVKKAKRIAFGAEVVAGFLLGKETEYKVISIILAGRAAGLSGELIRERVRDLYA